MPRKPVIYTVEVDGKPTLAFAGYAREAAEICKEEWFRDDLTGLTSSGVPLCVPGSTLKPRIANASEMVDLSGSCQRGECVRRHPACLPN